MDIDKILISNQVSFGVKGYKYFISYKADGYKIRPLCIMLPKLSEYVKSFDETRSMSFFVKDEKLLKRNNKIWDNVSKSNQKEFNSKPVNNKKYLKTEIKPCKDKFKTDFNENGIPKMVVVASVYH